MVPADRWYTPDDVWITDEGRVGVTPRLLEAIPRIERLYLPSIGAAAHAARSIAQLEGDKGAFDVYAPCDGTVLEVNTAASPEELRDRPFDTWLFRLDAIPTGLWDAQTYTRRRA